MIGTRLVRPEHRESDDVVLAEGTYQGTVGIFLHLREDVKMGGYHGAQWQHPHPSGGVAGAFRKRQPGTRELT